MENLTSRVTSKKMDVAELVVLFTAIGFYLKSTEEVPHNDKGTLPNGELKIEITCSVSGTKTTLIKTSHECKCPPQEAAGAVDPQLKWNIFEMLFNVFVAMKPTLKMEENQATPTIPLIYDNNVIYTPPRSSTPVETEGSDTLSFIVQTFQLLSNKMNNLMEIMNNYAEKHGVLNQTFTKGTANRKRISDIMPNPSPGRNTPLLNKFIDISKSPSYLSKQKLSAPKLLSTPRNADKRKLNPTTPLANKKKINSIPILANSKTKSNPVPRCASINTEKISKSTITKK